jgi:hypothetical protein
MFTGWGTHVGAVAIQDFVVVLDLEDAVLDNVHGEIESAVNKQAEGNEILPGCQRRREPVLSRLKHSRCPTHTSH